MNRFYADHGQTPEVAMEFTSNEAVRESVRAGLAGLTCAKVLAEGGAEVVVLPDAGDLVTVRR